MAADPIPDLFIESATKSSGQVLLFIEGLNEATEIRTAGPYKVKLETRALWGCSGTKTGESSQQEGSIERDKREYVIKHTLNAAESDL